MECPTSKSHLLRIVRDCQTGLTFTPRKALVPQRVSSSSASAHERPSPWPSETSMAGPHQIRSQTTRERKVLTFVQPQRVSVRWYAEARLVTGPHVPSPEPDIRYDPSYQHTRSSDYGEPFQIKEEELDIYPSSFPT
jgi:hypothetical protein